MIEYIKNIGQYVIENYPERSQVKSMVRHISDGELDSVLEIDITENKVTAIPKLYYKDVTVDALFYSRGRAFVGGGIRLDSAYKKNLSLEENKKNLGNGLAKACEFCEIEESDKAEIVKIVEAKVDEYGWNMFVLLKKDGKTPKELFLNKFLDTMQQGTYKKVEGQHICHLCRNVGSVYNTAVYKFFTNDKNIYSNINDKNKDGFAICSSCLEAILQGKTYVSENHNCFFSGSTVMFLPHTHNEDIAKTYAMSRIGDVVGVNLLALIKENEADVFDELGKTNSITDIVFYEHDSKSDTFTITYHIQSILPSRFTQISLFMKEQKLSTQKIFSYLTAVKSQFCKYETLQSEKAKLMADIFGERRVNSSQFFKRVMDVYKRKYFEKQHKFCINEILRIYNFLNNCNCLEKGSVSMQQYKNHDELFQTNITYFNSDEKKAWFLIGKASSGVIYNMKKVNKSDSEGEKKENNMTSLDKTFYFSRKFDFKDFMYFTNLLNEKISKYKSKFNKSYLNDLICESKDYMAKAKPENKLGQDEAKFLFFWGKDTYFAHEKEVIVDGESNAENEELELKD